MGDYLRNIIDWKSIVCIKYCIEFTKKWYQCLSREFVILDNVYFGIRNQTPRLLVNWKKYNYDQLQDLTSQHSYPKKNTNTIPTPHLPLEAIFFRTIRIQKTLYLSASYIFCSLAKAKFERLPIKIVFLLVYSKQQLSPYVTLMSCKVFRFWVVTFSFYRFCHHYDYQ